MPRFKNSNRHATELMTYTGSRQARKSPMPEIETSYYRRIGFDFAMI